MTYEHITLASELIEQITELQPMVVSSAAVMAANRLFFVF